MRLIGWIVPRRSQKPRKGFKRLTKPRPPRHPMTGREGSAELPDNRRQVTDEWDNDSYGGTD